MSEQLTKQKIPENLDGGFLVYGSKDEKILYVDDNIVSLLECDSLEEFDEYVKGRFENIIHPDDAKRVSESIKAQTMFNEYKHYYVRYRILTRKGKCRFVESYGHLMKSSEKDACYYAFITEIESYDYGNYNYNSFAETNLFESNKKVDKLTKLLNIDAFFEMAKKLELDRKAEENNPTSIIIFDIIGLGEINKKYGHDEGDKCICDLLDLIYKYMPKDSIAFRGYEAELIVVCKNIKEDVIIGNVINIVDNCSSSVLFGIGSVEILSELTDEKICIKTLENAQLDLKIKKMLNKNSLKSQILISLVKALEEVDSETKAHVQRTQKMGLALGKRVGLSDYQLTLLQLLCLLHDIGKIAIPLEILNKPGKLTEEEWNMMKSHAEKGYQITTSTNEFKLISDIILYHHERWDGNGYPFGLAKDDIPVLSRIISIVDAYDAMVNDRCYRKAMPPETAKQEIKENAGTQFDPYLANEFLSLLDEDPTLAIGTVLNKKEVKAPSYDKNDVPIIGKTEPILFSMYYLDKDDFIIKVDDKFETLTGYTKEEVIGKLSQIDLIPKEEQVYYIKQVEKQFSNNDVAYLRHPLQKKDGSVIWVACSGERYFDSSVREFRVSILIFEQK